MTTKLPRLATCDVDDHDTYIDDHKVVAKYSLQMAVLILPTAQSYGVGIDVVGSMYSKHGTSLVYNKEKFEKVPNAKGRAIQFQEEGPFPGGGRDQVM